MSTSGAIEFRYFSPVAGRVVPRFGTDSFIGASRGPKGFTVNSHVVVAVPAAEVARYPKEYRNCLTRGDLVSRTKSDFEAFQSERRQKSERGATSSTEQPPKQAGSKKGGSKGPANPQ